jgi:hypothetical protein
MALANMELNLTFTTPVLATNLSTDTPVTYVSFELRALDGRNHSVEVYFDVDGEHVTNDVTELLTWGRVESDSLRIVRAHRRVPGGSLSVSSAAGLGLVVPLSLRHLLFLHPAPRRCDSAAQLKISSARCRPHPA